MLELKQLLKTYTIGNIKTHALNDVSITFRKKEFVAILGPSGSGKTTLLNVIGGLDRYDSGDLIINGQSTKNFKETDWDAYRNNSVGFVFQSYNLISHLSIMANVELGMDLSGVDSKTRHEKAVAALTKVGLKDQIHKNPNQLSGGQMQRVAIARAIANDPDILLCDEPTGALDTKTSEQIMQLIKDLSKDRLVIMVTHNPELAEKYASRIVHFQDGKILSDSNPDTQNDTKDTFKLKRTKMSYWNAVKLSFTNIMTKKGRTILTAFASSIGIISIAIVLAISNGFQKQINTTMGKALAKYPIAITQTATNMTESRQAQNDTKNVKNKGFLTAELDPRDKATHNNNITQNYVNYVKKINPDYANNISLQRSLNLNLLGLVNGKVQRVQFSSANGNSLASMQNQAASSIGIGSSVFPEALDKSKGSFLKENYQLLAGSWPKKATDLVLVIDNKNTVNINALKNLGLNINSGKHINLKTLIGKQYRIVDNNDYYQQLPNNTFVLNPATQAMYNNAKTDLNLVAVIKAKNENAQALLGTGIAYSEALPEQIIASNENSNIVKAQRNSSYNVLTGQKITNTQKQQLLQVLGGSNLPIGILIYPTNFANKDKVLNYLDAYNKGKSNKNKIIYTDMSSAVTQLTGGLLSGITIVLVAFAAISLITSMIMIGILTYTSVLERTKEIGILKALGARKKDITRVFDAETFILGAFSGILGVFIAYLLTFPISAIISKLTNLHNVAQLNPIHALILIIISTILTILGGHIPARMAAKKDAATALRSE